MKKKITTLLVGILAIVITANAQAPVVSFTGTPQVVCDSSAVTFTNTSTNAPTSWTWYFPGSNTPIYTTNIAPGNPPAGFIFYDYTGIYNVTCVATNASGSDSVTIPNYILVDPLPTASIDPPSGGICDTGIQGGGILGSVDDTVYFNLKDTTRGSTYKWLPTTGLSCSTCPNPKAYPYVSTVYTLTVTGIDGCKSVYYDTIDVGSANIRAEITGQSSICAGFVDSLTASGGSSNPASKYRWSNGATTSTINVSPTVPTTYSVFVLTGLGGCTATASFNVNVYPVPHFTITSPDSICYPGSATISVTPGGSYGYYWYAPFGPPDTTANYTTSPTTTTNYTLVVQNLGCYFDSVVKIKVNDPPVVHFTGATNLCQGATTIICATGGTQYSWSTGATTSCVDVEPYANITYTVQVRDGRCFKDTAYSIIVDTMPNVKFIGDTSICQGDSTTIYVKPGYGYTYLWNTGSIADSVVTHAINNSVIYYLTVTKGACSKDSEQIEVKVYPHPHPIIYPIDTTVCEYDSVKLTAAGGDYYVWTPKNSGLNHYLGYGDTDRDNAAPFTTTQYSIKVCTWGCCKDTTATINIRPNVQGALVCCDTTVQGGTPVSLSATYDPGPYSIEGWYPATGLSCSTCANPTATVNGTTKYVVIFQDQNGCIVKDSITVTIFNCNVFVPNVFSPDQEVNNLLRVRSLCLSTMTFSVYDRFGNQVFETQNQNTGWDGTYKGKPMNMGTYVWYLTGLLDDGTDVTRSGNVTLIR